MNAHSKAATASGRQERAAITAPTLVSSSACVHQRSECACLGEQQLKDQNLDVCVHTHSKGCRIDCERLEDNKKSERSWFCNCWA